MKINRVFAAGVAAAMLSFGFGGVAAPAVAVPATTSTSASAKTTAMVVTGGTVNLRAKPNGKIVGVVKKGKVLTMTSKTSGKWRQLANGRWIHSSYLASISKPAAQPAPDPKPTATAKPTAKHTPSPSPGASATPPPAPQPPEGWKAQIRSTTSAEVKHTWRKGCPVGVAQLSTIEMTYRDYAGVIKTGELIVHQSVAKQVRDAFKEAFEGGARIFQMVNPNQWKGKDIPMMAANNTSAFNCRQVTGNASRLSPHSYGKSIDINPAQNPYRVGGKWYPNAKYATNRPKGVVGMHYAYSPMVKALKKRGFSWYSGWDWHHFQK